MRICVCLFFTLLLHTVKYSELQLISQCEVLRGLIRINNPYRALSCFELKIKRFEFRLQDPLLVAGIYQGMI
jgi:hypothetical protein